MKIFDFKRMAAAVTAICLCVSLAACGSSDNDSKDKSDNSKSDETSAAADTSSEEEPPAITLPPADSEEPAADDSSSDELPNESELDLDTSDVPMTPAAWKVTSPDGNTMYMMGSMHALKDECYPLPDYIEEMYTNADVLAVECDISDTTNLMSVMLQYTDKMTYPEGETIVDHLGEELWSELASYIECYGNDASMYEIFQAWYVYDILETLALLDTGLQSELGLDMTLLNRAHEEGKQIYEVETIELQMDLLSSLSDDAVKAITKGYSAENRYAIAGQSVELYKAWKSGDLDALMALSEGEEDNGLTAEEQALVDDFNNKLLYDRNIGMAEKAMELIDSGDNVFYVVGLLHYPGEGGVLDLLEKKGCTVERVEP